MKTDIILCGVGGQGILSIATIIGEAAMKEDLYIKQAEVHGMSQRGGDVQSNLRISSEPIASDLIPTGSADVIISMEPMEALRYLPFLSKDGWIITSSAPFVNIPNYPTWRSCLMSLCSTSSRRLRMLVFLVVPTSSCWVLPRRLSALNMRSWKMPSVACLAARAMPLSRQISRH